MLCQSLAAERVALGIVQSLDASEGFAVPVLEVLTSPQSLGAALVKAVLRMKFL